MTLTEPRGAIELIECPDDDAEDEDEVEVVQYLFEDNGTQVALVGELIEDGGRGATHRITEIDRIAEVDAQGQTVDEDEHPPTDLLVEACLLAVPGQEHEYDVGDIRDKDG